MLLLEPVRFPIAREHSPLPGQREQRDCEGDFDQEVVSEAQLHGAALAFAWATQTFQIATDTLAGHRDLAQTACPGANLYAHISSGDLKRRVEDLLVAGRIDLQRICGPDATAKVAAIEAGY